MSSSTDAHNEAVARAAQKAAADNDRMPTGEITDPKAAKKLSLIHI